MRYSAEHGTWQLDDLPGCTQVCVSHSAFVIPSERNKGLGKEYHLQRLKQIEALLYDYTIATVDNTNERQKRILIDAGWKVLDSFWSSKTQHQVLIFGKQIG